MPHIPNNLQFNNNWSLQQLMTSLQKAWQQLAGVLNNNVGFGNPTLPLIQGGIDNIDGVWLPFNTGAGGVDITLNHNLERIPVGYITMQLSAACILYTGAAAWTDTTITLRGSVGGVTGYVFVI